MPLPPESSPTTPRAPRPEKLENNRSDQSPCQLLIRFSNPLDVAESSRGLKSLTARRCLPLTQMDGRPGICGGVVDGHPRGEWPPTRPLPGVAEWRPLRQERGTRRRLV